MVSEGLFYVKQDIKFPKFGHMWFFTITLIWYHAHKDTQLTQGLISLHQGIMQSKNDNGYCFGAQKVWCSNLTSLACLHLLKTKILIKNGMILILKFAFKKCSTTYLSRINIKQNAINLPVCNIFWRLWYSGNLIHSYRCPNSNLVLGPGRIYIKIYYLHL